MEKIIKSITKDIYVANDGKEFDSEWNCEEYENEQKQEKLEREVEEKIGLVTHANFPSMLDSTIKREYKLFSIKNVSDLDLFVSTYEYWFTDLSTYREVQHGSFTYPDVLCILDFPTGGDSHRLYRISELSNQFYAFESELALAILPPKVLVRVEKVNIDEGFCREYYKEIGTNRFFVVQEEYNGVFKWYTTDSKDGEPEFPVDDNIEFKFGKRETYIELTKRQQKEFNEFPMIYAFSNDQFKEGMNKLGLKITDTNKIFKTKGGGYYRKTDSDKLHEIWKRHDTEMKNAIAEDITGEGFILEMFSYELANHEYCFTQDHSDTLDALDLTYDKVVASPNLLSGFKKACEVCSQED